ncbi:MAG: peptide-methionine (R)-S-oxide reductase, partial [Desulfuromonas sp.]
MRQIITLPLLLILITGTKILCQAEELRLFSIHEGHYVMSEKIEKSDAEWRSLLSREQYHILREKGTEAAFSGSLWNEHRHGAYSCAGCGLDLFHSEQKYDSGTGWPSFSATVAEENILREEDNSFFMRRTEVLCARCSGHLGHVFPDGPPPGGERFCMNSL